MMQAHLEISSNGWILFRQFMQLLALSMLERTMIIATFICMHVFDLITWDYMSLPPLADSLR